ncbi:tRNAHis guanylyltransferase Thg1, putative [Paecilomyces variotii No. 5]|uniref:tRNAHis guanylyltransferase Thg1, putative n=1 Tax=Byssochlamys spectabilis (strain No. 5 / NBRC 109023) TaxID=1356009 RepID=V5G9Q0_BYSSN|nr:tRNAHis guanylyltransferase Thg1, putative [Paecilomyces variotii No. 5]
MNTAAVEVMKDLTDLVIAYGVSDEYSFVFHPTSQLFERRSGKLITTIVSTFTAHYIFKWSTFFPETPLEPSSLPSFDGHINNLYNTTFWTMIQKGGMTNTDAERELKGTVSSDKNEILFTRFGINYNNEPEIYKKGSVIYRQYELEDPKSAEATKEPTQEDANSALQKDVSKTQQEKIRKLRRKAKVVVDHIDIIKDEFWQRRPWILSNKPGKLPVEE